MNQFPRIIFLFVLPLFFFSSLLNYRKDLTPWVGFQYQVDENVTMHDRLEKIPVCETTDRNRQRMLLKLFLAWKRFAAEHQIPYWLAYGSLVGYVQRRGLLPHDGDVDVLIRANDTKLLVPFASKNFSSIYKLKLQPDWGNVSYENRSYYRDRGINFVAPNARFVSKLSRYHIDIWPMYNGSSKNNTLMSYGRGYRWSFTPYNWTFPLKPCEFSGIQVWCPAEVEKHVIDTYDKTALNQSDTRCVNGSWV